MIANLSSLKNEAPGMTIPIPTLQAVFPGLLEGEARNLQEQGEIHEYPTGAVLYHEEANERTFYSNNGEIYADK
jgi:hypothetical protein